MKLPLLHRSKIQIGLEMIDFQDDPFGNDIEAVLTGLQSKVMTGGYSTNKELQDSPELQQLGRIIFERLGLKTEMIVNGNPAAILPFYSNKNHIFINKYFRGEFEIRDQQKILNKADGKKGTVNRKQAKVGGLFSEYENMLFMNYFILFKEFKLSVPEVTAVLLHELGHAYHACEYSDRLEGNNQILANVAKELNSKKEKADVSYIYRELQVVNPKVTHEEVDKLINGNKVIAGYTWFKVIIGSVETQNADQTYDESSFEQIADSFAARFKYGRPLLTALDKMHRNHADPAKSKSALIMIDTIETLVYIAVSVSTFFIASVVSIPMALFVAIALVAALRLKGEDFKDYTYDDLKIRYKRIRNEQVALLKEADIPLSKVKFVLEDISTMDRCIDETFKHSGLLRVISNFIFDGARNADKSINEQQLLEELSFNDLFIKSKQLELLK